MDNFIFAVISFSCFIPAIIVHEVAHGFAALKMGDTTAKDAKRLSFNPLNHIDPFGTVVLPLMLVVMGFPAFGFAKPVPYNPTRLKNMKVGEVVVGFAGPASNLIMALLAAAVGFGLRATFGQAVNYIDSIVGWLYLITYLFAFINLVLMFFNLLPIPPLDGSSIIMPFLPKKYIPTWYNIQRYAFPVLIILVIVVPYVTEMFGMRIDLISMYLQFTAYNVIGLLFP